MSYCIVMNYAFHCVCDSASYTNEYAPCPEYKPQNGTLKKVIDKSTIIAI